MYPKNNESWQEMKQRHRNEECFSAKVGIITACLIILPFVCWLLVDVIDKAVK